MLGIVTPSYNQGQFIEQTIDSVLSQGYPNLQYVIIDGGSTDNSVEVIRKYEKHLTYWVSEKDRGQSHAINKGLARLNVDVWAYLNSDDFYMPDTFAKVMDAFADPSVQWVTGAGRYIDVNGDTVRDLVPIAKWTMAEVVRDYIPDPVMAAIQGSNFMRAAVFTNYGPYREDLHYCMDFEFNHRVMMDGGRPHIVDGFISMARLHPASKTVSKAPGGAFAAEKAIILRELLSHPRMTEDMVVSAKKALSDHRKLSAVAEARREWEISGKIGGLLKMAQSFITQPYLIAYRPALGLVRQIMKTPGPSGSQS